MSESLSLWKIETELAELLNAREELIELGEDLAPIEQTIAEYVQREIKKADGIRSYLKYAEMMTSAATAEATLQDTRAKLWQGRIDRLKEFCRVTMEAMPWKPDQVRRIDGRTGSLMLKTNGGKQEVVITKPDLLPDELVQYEGRISGQAWVHLARMVGGGWKDAPPDWSGRQDVQMERVPHKGRIAEALSRPCATCQGSGNVLVGGPPTAEYSFGNVPSSEQCSACDGDGLARVPGAHFAARGQHVEIR